MRGTSTMPKGYFMPSPCASFVVANCAALTCAAVLPGGPDVERRTKRLVDDLSLAPPMTRRLRRELDALEDLLSLRHVNDPDRIEAERFAQIDPENPVVVQICLLLENLRAARAAEDCLIGQPHQLRNPRGAFRA